MFLHQDKLDKIFHDPKLTTVEKLTKLGETAEDKAIDLEKVYDEKFKTKANLVPTSSTLQMQFKYYLMLMYAAQYAGKRILEESYKIQAETINLLHKSSHGHPVADEFWTIKSEDIQLMIKDMEWDKPSIL